MLDDDMKELFKIFLKGIILFKIITFFIEDCFKENRFNRGKKIERINSFIVEIIFFILYLFMLLEFLTEMIDSIPI